MRKSRNRIMSVLGLVLVLLLTGCIGPPFYGSARVGHAYRSAPLRDGPGCQAIKDYYGWRNCWYHPYPAVDFRLPMGHPIRAVESGWVFIASEEPEDQPDAWPRAPGRFIVLDHRRARPGYRPPEFTRYSHLSGYGPRIYEGMGSREVWVKRGTIIGYAGDTQSPNVHLHFDAFHSLRDNTPTGGFNTYQHQADYGIMEWCDRGYRIGGRDTFQYGDVVTFRADGRNCR